MTRGANLTARQLQAAIAYNRRPSCAASPFLRLISLIPIGTGDREAAFARYMADWQEDHIGPGEGDGIVGPKTEAYLGFVHPKALSAARQAEALRAAGNTLFDSWGNDLRDNNDDGIVDDRHEQAGDGEHFHRTYTRFRVIAGEYSGLGWNSDRTMRVTQTRTLQGSFKYRVCADIASAAYSAAGVMHPVRSTAAILQAFRNKGHVFRRSEANNFPPEYLPGDFICTYDPSHGGHSGIVVARASTRTVPIVVELPGPSTLVDLGEFDPASTNDIRKGPWTKEDVPGPQYHYLGRLLLSKFPA